MTAFIITTYEGVKYYIGVAPSGLDEASDIEFIAGWGSTFPKDIGDNLFEVQEN